jgi:hypothetical protein
MKAPGQNFSQRNLYFYQVQLQNQTVIHHFNFLFIPRGHLFPMHIFRKFIFKCTPPPLVQGTPISKAHTPFGPHFFHTRAYLGQGGGTQVEFWDPFFIQIVSSFRFVFFLNQKMGMKSIVNMAHPMPKGTMSLQLRRPVVLDGKMEKEICSTTSPIP